MELTTKGFVRKIGRKILLSRIKTWPISYVMEKLWFLFKAEDCDEQETITHVFAFPDVDHEHSFTMRHWILDYRNSPELIPGKYDVKATCNSDAWKAMLTNSTSLESFLEKVKLDESSDCRKIF